MSVLTKEGPKLILSLHKSFRSTGFTRLTERTRPASGSSRSLRAEPRGFKALVPFSSLGPASSLSVFGVCHRNYRDVTRADPSAVVLPRSNPLEAKTAADATARGVKGAWAPAASLRRPRDTRRTRRALAALLPSLPSLSVCPSVRVPVTSHAPPRAASERPQASPRLPCLAQSPT